MFFVCLKQRLKSKKMKKYYWCNTDKKEVNWDCYKTLSIRSRKKRKRVKKYKRLNLKKLKRFQLKNLLKEKKERKN